MNSGSIFFESNGDLEVLAETGYETEDVLQELMAKFPRLLAGGTTGGDTKPLLLVKREMGVPTSPGGSATFSADHLFVDPDGVPVIVEVKRRSDTRIRREVVGQMLDYAANGRLYWPAGTLRSEFERQAKTKEQADQLATALAEHAHGTEPAEFWTKVENNLKDGRVRLVFVADQIPPELTAIIEFLNEQMNPAEVLGVEVRRYRSDKSHPVAYVPHLVGATATAVATKQPDGGAWPPERFIEEAKRRCKPEDVSKFEDLLAHVNSHGGQLHPGRGVTPTVSGMYPLAGGPSQTVWNATANTATEHARPYVYFYLGEIMARVSKSQFDTYVAALEAVPALKPKIKGAREAGWTNKFPSVHLADLEANKLENILTAIEGLLPASSVSSTG